MPRKIAVIGGDKRMIALSKMLSIENEVVTYGQELFKYTKLRQIESLYSAINYSDIIICPIPFTKDNESVFAEYSKEKIIIKELLEHLDKKILIAGAIPQNIIELSQKQKFKVIDIMKCESLTVLNTIATAEGTIKIAIERTEKIIQKSNVLILGYGRVAKVVAQKFKALNANVTCAARRKEALAWIETDGYESININTIGENLKNYDIIINTPPAIILTKERLKYVKKDCLIIDLASNPGGVDRNAVKELKLNFEWALALPGKIAPISAAEHIKRTLDEIFEKEEI